MKVAEWLKRHPSTAITVPPDCPLEKVMDRVLAERCLRDIYVVSREGKLIGHLSYQKLIHFVLAKHRAVHTRRQLMQRVAAEVSEDLMNAQVVYAKPDEEVDNVIDRQLEHGIDDMPVIDDQGVMLGVINIHITMKEFRKNSKMIIE